MKFTGFPAFAVLLFLAITGAVKAQSENSDLSRAVLDFHSRVAMGNDILNCQYHNEQSDIEGAFLEFKATNGKLIKVVGLLCYPHQHRSTTIFYRVEKGGNNSANGPLSIKILDFQTTGNGLEFSSTKTPLNAEFDLENKTIISEYTAPHFVNCGFSNTYKWDGKKFSLSQARAKPCCKPLQRDVENQVDPSCKKKYNAPKWDRSEEDDMLIDKIMQEQDEQAELPLVFNATAKK